MATIRPFRAVRPYEGFAADIAALPYDVYTREEAAVYAASRPLSFLNIDRPETQFPPSFDMYSRSVYAKAAEMIESEVKNGLFVEESRPCLYLYELTMVGRAQTGLVALSSVDDYLNGVCRKHENTVLEKELDRINHIDITSCQTGPIFLAYRNDPSITDIISCKKEESPLYDFTSDDSIRHRVWRIDDNGSIGQLTALFRSIPHTYIADGHHRAASAVKVALKRRESHPGCSGNEEFNYFLSVLFPDSELMIMDYNRIVRGLNGHTPEEFMNLLDSIFDIAPLPGAQKPSRKASMSMFLSGNWYSLAARPDVLSARQNDPVASLDVSLLQDLVLSSILGIADPRTDKRIKFVGGIRGIDVLESSVRDFDSESGDHAVAFAMFPTSIGELLNVADANLLMPPKSTWFEPKLRSGLFLHRIER